MLWHPLCSYAGNNFAEREIMENSAVSNLSALTRANGSVNADRATLMRMKTQGDERALRMSANEFVGVFIGQMYKVMGESVGKSELMNGGAGEEMFRTMLYDEYARQAAHQDRTGLGETVYQSLKSRNQAINN
ncbi:hypothetical protein AGMMS49959_01290 [Planctomycetales bacterium]|nr:hypothetical protein AGMMS49959_01290 [Planctomycetales bacterium]